MIKHFMVALLTVIAVAMVQAQNRVTFNTPQDAVKYYEKLIGELVQQVRRMQDENAALEAKVVEIQQKVAQISAKNESYSADIDSLKKQIAADAETRKTQLNRLAEKLVQPPPAPAKEAAPQQSSTPQGEFFEHTVEAGTTLTALAKAYGVSVADIKKANKLSNNNIRVGQKLLIPAAGKKH